VASEDVLTLPAGAAYPSLVGTWLPASGTLSIAVAGVNGSSLPPLTNQSASLAEFQAALRAVTYASTNTALFPTLSRQLLFWAWDQSITQPNHFLSTNVVTRGIVFTAINHAPAILSGFGDSLVYVEGAVAAAVDAQPFMQVSDPDMQNDRQSPDISLVFAQIVRNLVPSEDVLLLDPQRCAGGLNSSWDAASGRLTMWALNSTNMSLALATSAVSSVLYLNTNTNNPSPATRSVSVWVQDSGLTGAPGALQSAPVGVNMTVSPVNNAPTASSTPYAANYTQQGAATVCDPGLTLADVDDANMTRAFVMISPASFVAARTC